MKKLLLLACALTLSPAAYASHDAYCREYTKQVVVGNRTQEGYGTACLQPDGSWQIVSEAPERTITFRDAVPLPSVSQPFWERKKYYWHHRPYRHDYRPSSGLVLSYNFDSGRFFTTGYSGRDHHRHDRWKRDRHDHHHDRGHHRGHRHH